MKGIRASLVVLLGMCLFAGEAGAFSVSYDQKVTRGKDVFVSQVTVRDELFRIEVTMAGETSVTLLNRDGIYTYLPSTGMAMRLPKNAESPRPVEHADNYSAYLKERNAERIGSKTIDGHACDVYQFTDPAIHGTTKAWVWKEKAFPLQLEMDGSDGKTLVQISNIQLGVPVPDTAFQLPPGVQVMDVGSSMMGMPQR